MAEYTFKLLAADTFTYTLEMRGLIWIWDPPEEVKSETKHIFEDVLGDAIMIFLERHNKRPGAFHFNNKNKFESAFDLKEYVGEAIQDIIQNDCFLMNVIRILALFVDLVFKLYQFEDYHFIEPALDYLDAVYKVDIKKPLFYVGGYYTLFRFSKEYLNYNIGTSIEATSEPAAAAGAAESSCTMTLKQDCRFSLDMDTEDFVSEDAPQSIVGTAEPRSPIKSSSAIATAFRQSLLNEFSSPHSEHCQSEFCRTPESDKSETNGIKLDTLKRRLSFSD